MIGDNIKRIRKEKNMSQLDLVAKAREISKRDVFTQAALSTWESNKICPNKENLKLLSKILDCKISDFIDYSDIKKDIKKKGLYGTIGGNIEFLRLTQGMSRVDVVEKVSELNKKIKFEISDIYRLENNQKILDEETLIVLCKAFKCKRTDITGGRDLEKLKKESSKINIYLKNKEAKLDNSFGSKLIQIRLKKFLSQKDISRKSNEITKGKGFSASCFSAWELNKTFPNKENMELLSKVFDCSISELIGTNDIDTFYAEIYEKNYIQLYKKIPQPQDKIDDNPIGERFFKTRLKRNLSMQKVEELARKINTKKIFTSERLSALEHRKQVPTKEDIELLLKIYGCTLFELTGYETMREAIRNSRKKVNLKNRNERITFNDNSFGSNLRRIRQEKNMTQDYIISKAKKEKIQMSNKMTLLENNKQIPSESEVKVLAKILNCKVADLIGTDNIKTFWENSYNKKMEKYKSINNIGLNIKLLRKKNKLTQINTIKKAKEFTNGEEILTLKRLSVLERNVYKPTDKELEILAGIFNCNVSDIDYTKE